MTGTALADLDELVLHCRDDRARSYIAEAVACYRGGAYRAAIVATWVAVCFDITDKLRELTLAGDKEAEQIVIGIENTRQQNDMMRALKLERELLKMARDKFELLSHVEYIDLERLQQDRNRCAHPSLISEEEPFAPSGELARLHIRSAVEHLLRHAPVQGKYALDRLLQEVGSDYFPNEVTMAKASLSSGPLKRPRESLVRNFVIVLVKQFLDSATEWKQRLRAKAALGAVKALHNGQFETTLRDKLPALIRAVDDADLHLSTQFVCAFPECWTLLPTDVKNRLAGFVENLPSDDLSEIDVLLKAHPFKAEATRRAERITREEFKTLVLFELPEALVERGIDLYLSSRNFSEANDFAKAIAPYLGDFNAQQQERLLLGVSGNGEVLHSFELGSVITSFRKTEKISPEKFEALLKNHGLEKFVQEQNEIQRNKG